MVTKSKTVCTVDDGIGPGVQALEAIRIPIWSAIWSVVGCLCASNAGAVGAIGRRSGKKERAIVFINPTLLSVGNGTLFGHPFCHLLDVQ
jgi:hypothetical protein